jgi:hypothetical protein
MLSQNREVKFIDDLPAPAAHLGSVGRVHNNQLVTSFFHKNTLRGLSSLGDRGIWKRRKLFLRFALDIPITH